MTEGRASRTAFEGLRAGGAESKGDPIAPKFAPIVRSHLRVSATSSPARMRKKLVDRLHRALGPPPLLPESIVQIRIVIAT
jgi:hypothetical protein